MPAGNFTVTINPSEVADIDPDDGGRLSVYFQGGGSSAVISGDLKTLDQWARPANLAPAVSDGYVLTLPTNVPSGGSVDDALVGYDLTWSSGGARVQAQFRARPAGTNVNLSALTSPEPIPTAESALNAERAEAAAAAAEAANTAAQAVGTTNDTVIAGLGNDPVSAAFKALGRSVSLQKYAASATGGDWGLALQAALDDLAPTAGTVWAKSLYIPEGVFTINTPVTSSKAIRVWGAGRLASILRIGASFPSGGTVLSFIQNGATSAPSLEAHVPGLVLDGFTLDGNLRATPAHALKLHRFDRLRLNIGVNAFDGSALISTHSMRESYLTGLRTWMCGNATSPVVDIDQDGSDGSTEGGNLNHWHGVDLMYCIGDQLRIRSGAGVSTRYQTFVQCTFHGLAEWIDDYYDDLGRAISLTHEGNVPARIVIDNARGIVFDGCRIRQNGRGQPNLLMSNRAAGVDTVNSVFIGGGTAISARGGTATSRNISTVDTAANTLTVTGVATNRHHLQTGSRVRFTGTGLPAPLAQSTDYYAIRVSSTTFQVATSRANANAGTAVDLTATGTGSVTQFDVAVTVDATSNTLTALDHRLSTGARFRVLGTAPGGLALLTDYFVIRVDKDTVKLATTRANAESGTAIDITSAGTDVAIAAQDFLADVESGTLSFDNTTVDQTTGATVPRGFFRIESGASLVLGVANDWTASSSVPVAEYASGAVPNLDVHGTMALTRNNSGISVTRTDGTRVVVLRMNASNGMVLGTITGSDNATLAAAGLALVTSGGVERFRGGATGVSFNGVTAQVARRTVNAAATDAATTQALVNQLRQLLIDLGLAQ